MNAVDVNVITAREALKRNWNLQPAFQRTTQPSKNLKDALKESASNEILVVPVMIRNGEVGDGRKRMLVLESWARFEKEPPQNTHKSTWTKCLDGTKVVVSDFKMERQDFLTQFVYHNNINERMSSGELLNAQFQGFPEKVIQLINGSETLHKNKRLLGISFLGCLLTGSDLNARADEVKDKIKKRKDLITEELVEQSITQLGQMDSLVKQIIVAVDDVKAADGKKIRKPTSKSDQANILKLIEHYDTSELKADFDRLRDGWVQFVEETKDEASREADGRQHQKLAEALELKKK